MSQIPDRSYFFDGGLRFECQQCGHCCTGEPGTIYVSEAEIQSIAKFLNLPEETLKERHLYPFQDSYSIREHPDGRCFFFQDGCEIYPVRPGQCSSYPFWFTNLRSEKKWKSASKECPGIGQGRLHSKEEILDVAQSTTPWLMKSLLGSSPEKS